ncbi:MAG TPA: type IV pilus modification protein PilV [Pseudoxanthomonas sp.]|jgi:type IV pilus assembly protein PilV|nr:type IV pilus modification protein PilV [Pseudoxanthomonas sp.]
MSLATPPRRIQLRSRQRGVSLLEVMIAVLIMGIGMLGIAAMQTTALRNSQSSLERSQAVILAYSMFDAMRANRTAALAGGYDMGKTCELTAAGTLADNDRRSWLESMRSNRVLGTGEDTCGQIDCRANSPCTVTVFWDDSRAASGGAGEIVSGLTENSVQVTSEL